MKIDKKMAAVYKGLSHRKRIEILNYIIEHKENGVRLTDLFKNIKMPLQTIDFHLSVLKKAKLVTYKNKKRNVVYFPEMSVLSFN